MQPSQQLAFWVVAGSTSYKHDLVSLRGSLDKCDLFLKHFALLSCFCGLFSCVALSVKRLPTKSFSLNKPLHLLVFRCGRFHGFMVKCILGTNRFATIKFANTFLRCNKAGSRPISTQFSVCSKSCKSRTFACYCYQLNAFISSYKHRTQFFTIGVIYSPCFSGIQERKKDNS